jgi:hypothetical protein
MNLSKVSLGVTGCLFAAFISGCVVVGSGGHKDPPPPAAAGSITVDISIEGSHSAANCAALGVDHFDVDLSDDVGIVSSVSVDCELFAVTFDDLPEDFYQIDLTLVDFDGVVVSDIVTVTDLEVLDGQAKTVSVDFPESSIF